MRFLPVFFTFLIFPFSALASEGMVLECRKTYTMSSKAGIIDRYNGTDYIRYEPGKRLCDMKGPDSSECYFDFSFMEINNAVVGFYRQKRHPKDTNTLVLDLTAGTYYKTSQQGDLRVTIFANCKRIR